MAETTYIGIDITDRGKSKPLPLWTRNHFGRISLHIAAAGASNRLKAVAYVALPFSRTVFSCKSGEHTQCIYMYVRTKEYPEGRRKTKERSGERPLNGVTPRQSHHLSIVWAKPSKSTANRFSSSSVTHLLAHSCSLESKLILCPLCFRANTVHAGQPPPPSATKGSRCLRSSTSCPNFQLSILALHLSPRKSKLSSYRFATRVARNDKRDGTSYRFGKRQIEKYNCRVLRWNAREDGILDKFSTRSKLYRTKIYTCVFFGTMASR